VMGPHARLRAARFALRVSNPLVMDACCLVTRAPDSHNKPVRMAC